MKKLNLKLNPGEEPGMVLIGISSHENDYRLVWAINNSMKFKFARISNLILDKSVDDEPAGLSRYVFDDEERYIKYMLVSNRCKGGALFPEIRNIDYLVHVNGELIGKAVDDLLKTLKKMEIVTGAYLIDSSKLKGTERLLTE